jgi:pimeloyl-ACP methyl ester carboxylesterase
MNRTIIAAGAIALMAAPVVHAQARTAGSVRSEQKTVNIPGHGPATITLGFLSVPENRSNPQSRLIEVAFLRIPAKPGATGSPLVYLQGGPGDAGITEDPGALASFAPLLEVGDLVLFDQRGTGRSRPNLGYRWDGELPLDLFTTADAAGRILNRITRTAADTFRSRGVDIRGYTTVESADDLEDLRKALGVEKLNLLGFSYGTHLALATVRRHGARLDNVVLIGTEGPAHTFKLPGTTDQQWKRLSLMAAADPEIARYVPDLDALLRRVIARLEREPMVVTIPDPRTGANLRLPIGADGLRFILLRDIGDASDLPVFPRLLYTIDKGDPTMLAWFVQKRYVLGTNVMTVVMDQASGVSPLRRSRIDAEARVSPFGDVMNFAIPAMAAGLDIPDLGEEFRSPIVSNVRTLFLSGTLDWNTPPFQAEEVRWGFPNSSHIIVKNAGHEQVIPHPDVRRAIVAFLKGESVDGVTAAWPPLRFVPIEGYDAARTHPSVPRQ